MAALLFGCYPNARAHDPEIFTGQIVRLFLQYETETVEYVVDLLPGQKTEKWDGLPSYATIKEALDNRSMRLAINRERESRREWQLQQREEAERFEAEQRANGEHGRIVAGFSELRRTLKDGDVASLSEEAERKARQSRLLAKANWSVFEKECVAAGVDPAGGASPSLRRLLAQQAPARPIEPAREAAE